MSSTKAEERSTAASLSPLLKTTGKVLHSTLCQYITEAVVKIKKFKTP
jgi:hypothetical protein